MFFLLSSFRFCPPLKNDGRSELRFDVVLNDFLTKQKRIRNVSRPRLTGKGEAMTKEEKLNKGRKQKLNIC